MDSDLYIDGNIAQTFSPAGAEQYFVRLLGMAPRSFYPIFSPEWPLVFFVVADPTAQNVRPSLSRRALDFAISNAGSVVPQRLWALGNHTPETRLANVSLNMPIFFIQNDRVTLGLPLLSAIKGGNHRAKLLGAGDVAPIGTCSTIYVRISVRIILESPISHASL